MVSLFHHTTSPCSPIGSQGSVSIDDTDIIQVCKTMLIGRVRVFGLILPSTCAAPLEQDNYPKRIVMNVLGPWSYSARRAV